MINASYKVYKLKATLLLPAIQLWSQKFLGSSSPEDARKFGKLCLTANRPVHRLGSQSSSRLANESLSVHPLVRDYFVAGAITG